MPPSLPKKLVLIGLTAVLLVVGGFSVIQAAPYPAGTNFVLPGSSTVYFLNSTGQKMPYTSAGAFLSYGFNFWASVVSGNSEDAALPTSNSFVPPADGALMLSESGSDRGTVYAISGGQKLGFTSAENFLGLGYRWSNLIPGDVSFLPTGPVISSTDDRRHPAGALVNQNGTIYYLTPTGKIGIPTLAVFYSWGFSFGKVVPSNAHDNALIMDSVLQTRMAGELKPTPSDSPPQRTTLRELAAPFNLKIGSVYQNDPNPRYKAVFTREYNVVTAYVGWEVTHHESRTSYDFTSSDQAVEFGERNGFEIQGQSLVWYYLIPPWVERLPLSEIEAVMNEHIDRMVRRYAGRVKAWNVVNEAVDDEGRDLRRGFAWSNAMGDDYIAKAFRRAHQADPNAVLYYNEAGMESNEAIFQTVKRLLRDLLAQGVPVHALGWQMHLEPSFDPGPLLGRMNEIAAMGIDNYITELDVKLPENPTPQDYDRQKQIYRDVVRIFLQAQRRKTLVVWGLADGLDQDWLPRNHPLPFDERYEKKPAYFGIQEALRGTVF